VSQSVQVFQGAQHVEVVDGLGELALLNHRPDEDRGNLITARIVVLVPGHDQKAVVSLGKLDVRIQVLLQPGIALRDGAVMHVVIQIRNDER